MQTMLHPVRGIASDADDDIGRRAAGADHRVDLLRVSRKSEQETLARQAGFARVRHRPLAGGQMGLLELVA